MQLHIRHETLYRYEHPVKHSVQTLRLTPRTEPCQRVLSWAISAPGRQVQQVDAHGNLMHLLTLDTPHDEIRIVVGGAVETSDPPSGLLSDDGRLSPLAYVPETALTRVDPGLRRFAAAHGSPVATRDAVLALAQAVREAMDYVPGVTDVADTAAQSFAQRRGVCQDHAQVMLACCRALRIPARYVSGYVLTDDQGHVASHAWVDVWLEAERGWFSVDVTNRQVAGQRHCRLAIGRDYLDACPVRGVRRGGGGEAMTAVVSVSATPDRTPREQPRSRQMQQRQAQQ
jgi:transglutaminase-like putative cysteine protease